MANPPSSSNSPDDGGWLAKNFQNELAWAVFLVSTGGILYVAYLAAKAPANPAAKEIFNILVPVFSTWVGTILAFYFSKENFESAQATVRKAFAQTSEQALQQTSARQVMKKPSAITGVTLGAGADDDSIMLDTLTNITSKGATRVPIFRSDKTAKYVIHEGTLNKFIADSVLANAGFKPDATKLSDMLAAKIGPDDIKTIVGKIAFVGLESTLADARDAMLAIKGAEDVFVTKTGKQAEPIEGWVTNTDFAREL